MTKTQKNFIANVKRLRKLLGLSQMQLAERCRISTSYIGEIEMGRKYPSVETFQKIADALKVEPYSLLIDETALTDYGRNDLVVFLSEKIKRTVDETIDELVLTYIDEKSDFPVAAEGKGKQYKK